MSEVGDVWLDAGIVPFSTLGWQNPEPIEQGYATGASKGLSTADLPDHATVLSAPEEDAGAFAELVGRYVASLDTGADPADAWRDALAATGWEPAAEGDEPAADA